MSVDLVPNEALIERMNVKDFLRTMRLLSAVAKKGTVVTLEPALFQAVAMHLASLSREQPNGYANVDHLRLYGVLIQPV